MESRNKVLTVVLNLMDGRENLFALPPDEAVVAAYEVFEMDRCYLAGSVLPPTHPHFKEYRLGYSCGDWIAYKDHRILKMLVLREIPAVDHPVL